MRKLLLLIVAISLLLFSAGCGADKQEETEIPNDELVSREASSLAPPVQVESSKPQESSSSTSISTPSASEAEPEKPSNENPVTQSVPAINAAVFYDENEGGANLSVLCTGVGRYWLSYENSKSLLAYMDFSKLTPTDQTNNMAIDSAEPGIVFTASDFSYELRLDQKTNIAVYEIGGNTRYYYTMPDGFYDRAYEWSSTYAQYNYNEGDEDALNVSTGMNPYSEEN